MQNLSKIYPIVGTSAPEKTRKLAQDCLSGGASLIQVREKAMGDGELYELLLRMRTLCFEYEALLLVNDRVDLALAVDAAGVHLGQRDLPVEAARRLLGPQAVIGLSTHNRKQFEDAQKRTIDYVALGPVFGTATKPDHEPELGIEAFEEMARSSRLPVVAIGGIDLARARKLWAAGADSVAVISDLANHPDPAARVAEYIEAAEGLET